jgi:hypothetical protein
VGKDGFDAAVRSFGEVNKGCRLLPLRSPTTRKSHSRTALALSSSCSESFEQVIEIQSQYARMAYEAYVAELSKLGTGPQSELGSFLL